MTDKGLVCRGYWRVPFGDLKSGGYTDADAIFQKDFYDDADALKYSLVVERYDAHMRDGVLAGPTYVVISVVHSKDDEKKEIALSFSEEWSIDEVEKVMEQIYKSDMLVPSTK